MTDHKFTDDEIIHSLKVCSNDGDCSECLINPHKGNYGYCTSLAIKAALDLINRQKAEIEEKSKNITYAAKELIRLDRERSEVIKEFANNVVQELWKLNWHYGQLPCSEEDKTIQRAIKECIAVVERNTKVMTEENK